MMERNILPLMHLDCDCGRKISVPAHQAGQKVVCPGCGAETQAPLVPFVDQAGRLCPLCGSRNWKKIITPEHLNDELASRTGNFKEYTTFVITLPRECQECDTIWFPPAAKWAVFLLLLFGGIFLAWTISFFVWLKHRQVEDSAFWITARGLAAGGLLVVFSYLALTGKMGRTTVVALGKSPDNCT